MKKKMTSTTASNDAGKWYKEYPKRETPFDHSKTDIQMLDLKDEAKKCLNAETSAFQLKQSKSKDSEAAWLKTALTQGTSSDKVAASVVLIQDNPKYNLATLSTLVSQVKAAKHNYCILVITALKDLFLSDLLHPKFKLLKFEEQNLNEIDEANSSDTMSKITATRKKLLAHWYFEDQLREQYEHYVSSLGSIAADTVNVNREKAVSVMTDLLIGNAEQEHKLLQLIVNKIGDPSGKVGSKVVFCLNRLLEEHPNMKPIVLREVERLLFRSNVSQRAQYYGICLLTQFVMNKDDDEIASSLISVYFAFFKACLKKGEPDSRMMAAILTGVNRAYRFAKIDSNLLNDHIDSVYKVVHIGSFNVSLNALNLLYQVSSKDKARSNRFYSCFYHKLLDPQVGTTNKSAIFLNLLHRVLQNDEHILRLCSFIKRILQVSLYYPPNMTCAILYTISRTLRSHKRLNQIVQQLHCSIKLENNSDEENEHSTSDVNIIEGESIIKPKIEIEEEDSSIVTNIIIEPIAKASNDTIDVKPDLDIEECRRKQYDPFCRNPSYACAVTSFNAELVPLSKHFHPSVALFANNIIQGKVIEYTGDPLEDLTLIRFLDRYVFKNPKKLEDKKIQKKNDVLAQRAGYTPKGIRSVPIDSAMYLNEIEERIPVDELYLYKYLKNKNQFKPMGATKDEEDDNESVMSEEFCEMLDKLGTDKNLKDLDIAAELGTIKKKGTGNKTDDQDDEGIDGESDDDLENDDMGSDVDVNDDNDSDRELEDLSDIDLSQIDDEDLSDIDFNEESDEQSDTSDTKASSRANSKSQKQNKKGNGKQISEDVFMSAEKFAQMLEAQGQTARKQGGTNALSSLDGASAKQLDWEMKRSLRMNKDFGRKRRKNVKAFQNKHVKKFKRK